ALLTMAGCSDEIGNNVQQGKPIEGDGVYMKVNIITPASSGAFTKADGENNHPFGGEEGDGSLTALPDENRVRSVTIVLYNVDDEMNEDGIKNVSINNEDATIIASSYTTKIGDQGDESTSEYENHEYKATVLINSELLKDQVYYRVLAIVNADVTDQFIAGEPLSDAKMNVIDKYQHSETGSFIMSTHTEGMESSLGSGKTESIIRFTGNETSADAAAETSVWVERLSARIDYIGTKFDFKVENNNEENNNEEPLANVSLLGVAPVNVAKHHMYIFKQVTKGEVTTEIITLGDEQPNNPPSGNGVQAATNYVFDPTFDNLENKSFDNEFDENILTTINDQSGQLAFTDFSLKKWQGAITEGATDKDRIICYTGENTMGFDSQTHGLTTGVIFKAQYDPAELIVYDNEGKATSTKINNITGYNDAKGFYRVNNSIYYDLVAAEADLITSAANGDEVLKTLSQNLMSGNWSIEKDELKTALTAIQDTKDLGYIQFLSTQLESVDNLSNASTLNWKAFLTSKESDSPFPTNDTKENQKIEQPGLQTIEYYSPDHLCYYQYWIRHANNGDPNKMGIMEFCIVRNNVYQLAVTRIDGLGMPNPFDSTESPDEGTEEGLYLKVNLYVKNWVVRKNNDIILQ
ncbi:Mfa1 family fimbria major subunit, partial [Parabacteroides sp.]